MIWIDMIVENVVSDEQLRAVLQKLLNTHGDKIQIIDDYDDFPDPNMLSVVCHKILFKSDFMMMLSIYLFGKASHKIPQIDQFMIDFSQHTSCKCLLPSENENPSQMLLFEGTHKETVYIDEDILECDGVYVLADGSDSTKQ